MGKSTPTPSNTVQSWLYYREFGEGKVQPPVSASERIVSWLRHIQKKLFARHVSIVTPPDRLDNPPQSLKEILQQRMADSPVITPKQPTTLAYRAAIRNGVGAALVVMLVVGVVFLIKSVI